MADRIGRALTVVAERVAIFVAVRPDILHEGIEQGSQVDHRQPMLRNERFEAFDRRRCRARRVIEVGQCLVPCGQLLQTIGVVQVAFIGDVVGLAREAVKRDQRRAQVRGHQPGSDRKVFIMING